MDQAKFTMIDEDFICHVCNKEVKALGYTARDHCPYCLSSMHVDINPGDRACNCLGTLKPIAIEPHRKGKYKIVYMCEKCKILKRNIMADDDDMNLIIKIMSNPIDLNKIKKY